MRFKQLDEILELQVGQRIVARRTLRPEEDYLRDHFPHFPVMPGVMMLEGLYQAAMWLVRTSDDFAYPLVFLREAKGVKFADFLTPGDTLIIEAEWMKAEGSLVTLKAQGRKQDKVSVSARLVIERTHLPDNYRAISSKDIRKFVKDQFVNSFGLVASLANPIAT